MLHIPLGLLIEAGYLVWLWRRAEQHGVLELADLLPALFVGLGVWLLPALIVSDFGLFLLNLPVFILILGWLALKTAYLQGGRARARRRPVKWWLYRALGVGPGVVLLVAPFVPQFFMALVPEDSYPGLVFERNYLRLLGNAYPQRLEEIATRSSEELVLMSRVMQAYTSGPVGGRGYTRSELSPQLRSTALREHTLAIFIAGEWGTAGVTGLTAAYLVVAFAALALLPWRSWYQYTLAPTSVLTDLAGTLAALAGATFAFTSIYMILASYGWLPFTGKNLYLFGLDSGSDILESLSLLVILALGAAVLRDKLSP
jgi:hypothetical protein